MNDTNNVTATLQNGLPNKLLFTFDEVSAALSISRGMAHKLARTGRLEVVHIGRSVRIPRQELLRLCGAGNNTEVSK
jgi:excisionase family DNA binding protein